MADASIVPNIYEYRIEMLIQDNYMMTPLLSLQRSSNDRVDV
jgi:hypothetical protein